MALSLTMLASKKDITFKTSKLETRALLYEQLKEFNSPANGFLSATGQSSKMFFDKKTQDAPLVFDIVNLVVRHFKFFRLFVIKKQP